MRSAIFTFLTSTLIALLAACTSGTGEKDSTQASEAPTSPDTAAVAALITTDTASEAASETPTILAEGTLPKPNSPSDLATSKRTPPAQPVGGKQAPANQSAAPTVKSNPKGLSTGYISRKDVSLQTEPSESAAKTRSFKQYEGVIILDSKMTDDTGKPTDVPTWYKVECVDKKTGWVMARSVTLN